MEIEIKEKLKADNIKIGFNPTIVVKGERSPQSLTMDFHTEKGWIRIRLEGETCGVFNTIYKQHALDRLEEQMSKPQ